MTWATLGRPSQCHRGSVGDIAGVRTGRLRHPRLAAFSRADRWAKLAAPLAIWRRDSIRGRLRRRRLLLVTSGCSRLPPQCSRSGLVAVPAAGGLPTSALACLCWRVRSMGTRDGFSCSEATERSRRKTRCYIAPHLPPSLPPSSPQGRWSSVARSLSPTRAPTLRRAGGGWLPRAERRPLGAAVAAGEALRN